MTSRKSGGCECGGPRCGDRDSGSDGGGDGIPGGTTGEEGGGNGSEHGVGVDNRGTSLSCAISKPRSRMNHVKSCHVLPLEIMLFFQCK